MCPFSFIARDNQMQQLTAALDQGLIGHGQVRLVTGEAGSGKTALAVEFARRALEQHDDLVVAMGQCDARIGAGDAYLPFREVLAQLTGDVEGHLAMGSISAENDNRLRKLLHLSGQALAEVGPDLIGIFIPGAGILARAAAFAAERVGWLEKLDKLVDRRKKPAADVPAAGIQQEHVFEQYTNVLRQLAANQPLLLLLDDLQWADAASIELLFRLGRRIEDVPILIVGTYRPADVALGRHGERHPLEKVLAEFKRYFGPITIDLNEVQESEGRAFVDALLDTEANRLGTAFREALYAHTGGHPLFTVELLRAMQERGDLVQEQDHWTVGASLDWASLPARVEGVIEERIGRVEKELREMLTIASVGGEEFIAEAVARIRQADARETVRQLSRNLDKRHHLVQQQGIERIVGQRLSFYRFRHNLFQQYLYQRLDEIERAYLHEDMGLVLEELYGQRVREMAVQLARHFVEAEISDKATHYLRLAGEQAAARYANVEALEHLNQALTRVSAAQPAERYALLLTREQVHHRQGDRESQRRDLDELQSLADRLDDDQRRIEVALRQARMAEVTGDYTVVIAAGQRVIQLAEQLGDRGHEAAGQRVWGIGLARQGKFDAGRTHLEQALQLSQAGDDLENEGAVLNNFGLIAYNQGDYIQARDDYKRALEIARQLDDRPQESKLLNNLGIVSSSLGDYAEAESHYQQALSLFRQLGFRQGQGVTLGNLGNVSAVQGDYAAAKEFFEQALRIFHEIGDLEGEGRNLSNLGSLTAEHGEFDAAQSYLEKALAVQRQIGNVMGAGHALGNLGNVATQKGDLSAAKDHYQEALQIAREIGDRWSESNQLNDLGLDLARLGDYTTGLALCRESLEISREISDNRGEAASHYYLGILDDDLGNYVEAETHLETARDIFQAVGDRRMAGQVLAHQALVAHHQGDDQAAQARAQQALAISQEIADRPNQGAAWTYLGHAQAEIGELEEAERAYRQALQLGQDLGQPHRVVEAQAGLARVYLAQGNRSRALSQIGEILDHLEDRPIEGAQDRFSIYLTCYRVLQANQDPRARTVLATAHKLLQEQAERIDDAAIRRTFLEEVTEHREIGQAFASA